MSTEGKLQIESILSTVIIKIHCADEDQADALMDQFASQMLDEGRIVILTENRKE